MATRVALSARRAEAQQHSRASVRAQAQGTQPQTKSKIYLGKGRFIEDDATLYPAKDKWGTGGWAGGEQGLQKFVAEAQLEEAVQVEEAQKSTPSPGALGSGEDTIYVGKGQYIKDDVRMYPSKEDAGPLTGSTGGFAGGERGLQHFIRTQSLEPAPEELVNERQGRKDALAVVGVAASAGASYVAYLFLTGQPLPDVAAIADQMGTAASQMSDGAPSTGVPAVPGAVPSFSEGQIKAAAATAAVVVSVVGGKVVFDKTKAVVADKAENAKAFVEDNLVRLLVLGGAVAVYSTLLM